MLALEQLGCDSLATSLIGGSVCPDYHGREAHYLAPLHSPSGPDSGVQLLPRMSDGAPT